MKDTSWIKSCFFWRPSTDPTIRISSSSHIFKKLFATDSLNEQHSHSFFTAAPFRQSFNFRHYFFFVSTCLSSEYKRHRSNERSFACLVLFCFGVVLPILIDSLTEWKGWLSRFFLSLPFPYFFLFCSVRLDWRDDQSNHRCQLFFVIFCVSRTRHPLSFSTSSFFVFGKFIAKM